MQWCRAQRGWTATEWNQVLFKDTDSDLSIDDNRVRVLMSLSKCLNLAFALKRHTSLSAGVMQEYHKTASVTLPSFPGLLDPQICHKSRISGIIWDGKLDTLRV
ncbi:hypothetical protein TNCV_964171 [Trichonephila clavipes]|nr:hypothetical protein TNCV_964171 [Trichonephila clavipes]